MHMKYVIKRSLILTVILAVLVSALICPLSAASEEPGTPATLLALGDSITTGYGLDNYVYGGDPYLCNSYINRIAAAMGLEGGDTYINRAVNGDTSGDLASLLPGIEQDVKKAEMIIITIGGNDLLRLIPEIVTMIVGQKVSNYEDAAKLLKDVPAEEYADLAADPNFQGMIFGAMVKLNANLKTISDIIKEKAPDAKVIFLKQYNPLYAPPFDAFASFAQKFLDVVNDALEKNGQTYGFDVIDVPSVINEGSAELTNILEYDIHPNEQGHLEIAKLLAQHLNLDLDAAKETEPEETTSMPETTEAPAITTGAPETTEPLLETTASPQEPAATTEATVEIPNGCQATVSCAAMLIGAVSAACILKKKRA